MIPKSRQRTLRKRQGRPAKRPHPCEYYSDGQLSNCTRESVQLSKLPVWFFSNLSAEVHRLLRRRGTGVLLLAFPFFLERRLAFGNISPIAIRIDQWIRFAGLHLVVLGFQTKIPSMCSQKKIAGQALENGKRLHVILRNLRVVLVSR